MRIQLDDDAFMPERSHPLDAGLDIKAMYSGKVPAGGSMSFRTGVHIELPPNTAGLFVSRSGLMIHHDITSTGLIDENFRGEIVVKLFNHGKKDYWVSEGDRIGQLVIMPVMYEPLQVVEELSESDRGHAGFGSTGR